MKITQNIRILVIILIVIPSINCREKLYDVPKFTADELSWIKFDSVNYEFNDTGYLTVTGANPDIYEFNDDAGSRCAVGMIRLSFDSDEYYYRLFSSSNIYISKFRETGMFTVNYYISNWYHRWGDGYIIRAEKDTAIINGKIYKDVYKWNITSSDSIDFKEIVVAKAIGILRIVYNNGYKIEIKN